MTHYVVQSIEQGFSERPRRHESWQSAKAEAMRLSRLHPGTQFNVYALVAEFEKPDVTVRMVSPARSGADLHPDDIPF